VRPTISKIKNPVSELQPLVLGLQNNIPNQAWFPLLSRIWDSAATAAALLLDRCRNADSNVAIRHTEFDIFDKPALQPPVAVLNTTGFSGGFKNCRTAKYL
jgi:hypothetical protein